jgi:hypothetical protein
MRFHEKFVSLQQGCVIKNSYVKELVWSESTMLEHIGEDLAFLQNCQFAK